MCLHFAWQNYIRWGEQGAAELKSSGVEHIECVAELCAAEHMALCSVTPIKKQMDILQDFPLHWSIYLTDPV